MARQLKQASLAFVLLGVGAILSGCSTNFDPENFTDVFNLNKKEKLPGERRPLFPEGVPGVTQGVPPHLVKGQQQQEAEISAAPAPAPEPQKPKAAAKPKPSTASRPARVTVSPDQQPQAQQQQPQAQQQQQSGASAPSSSPWPSPAAQQPPPSSSPWPSAPPSGTFQR
jgi:hypothetical protein